MQVNDENYLGIDRIVFEKPRTPCVVLNLSMPLYWYLIENDPILLTRGHDLS